MKILVSALFYPSTGGIETVISLLAHEWVKLGHEVRVVTSCSVSPEDQKTFPFEVIRHPKAQQLLKQIGWCDVYLHANISLKTLWPLAVRRRTFVVTHQTHYRRESGRAGWQDRLKLRAARRAINIACSQATADDLPVPCTVIENPYEETKFFLDSGAKRDRELIFVGRLVSDKGMDVLLDALSLLARQNLHPRLTVVGDGPERAALEAQARELKLESQVNFVGRQAPPEVARHLNCHQVMVVPSTWNEPFGVVALEGIACGCVVIGSEGGGLKDAIGPCGLTFPNGDALKLSEQIALVLADARVRDTLLSFAPDHLFQHQAPFVARRYLEEIEAQK